MLLVHHQPTLVKNSLDLQLQVDHVGPKQDSQVPSDGELAMNAYCVVYDQKPFVCLCWRYASLVASSASDLLQLLKTMDLSAALVKGVQVKRDEK